MDSGGWLTIVQTIATFIEGSFGATLVVVAVAIAGARAALHGNWAISGRPLAAAQSSLRRRGS
jgi:type IV secretory pathway VirB2 component (pilin)